MLYRTILSYSKWKKLFNFMSKWIIKIFFPLSASITVPNFYANWLLGLKKGLRRQSLKEKKICKHFTISILTTYAFLNIFDHLYYVFWIFFLMTFYYFYYLGYWHPLHQNWIFFLQICIDIMLLNHDDTKILGFNI